MRQPFLNVTCTGSMLPVELLGPDLALHYRVDRLQVRGVCHNRQPKRRGNHHRSTKLLSSNTRYRILQRT
jgi:hypothetical protein